MQSTGISTAAGWRGGRHCPPKGPCSAVAVSIQSYSRPYHPAIRGSSTFRSSRSLCGVRSPDGRSCFIRTAAVPHRRPAANIDSGDAASAGPTNIHWAYRPDPGLMPIRPMPEQLGYRRSGLSGGGSQVRSRAHSTTNAKRISAFPDHLGNRVKGQGRHRTLLRPSPTVMMTARLLKSIPALHEAGSRLAPSAGGDVAGVAPGEPTKTGPDPRENQCQPLAR